MLEKKNIPIFYAGGFGLLLVTSYIAACVGPMEKHMLEDFRVAAAYLTGAVSGVCFATGIGIREGFKRTELDIFNDKIRRDSEIEDEKAAQRKRGDISIKVKAAQNAAGTETLKSELTNGRRWWNFRP